TWIRRRERASGGRGSCNRIVTRYAALGLGAIALAEVAELLRDRFQANVEAAPFGVERRGLAAFGCEVRLQHRLRHAERRGRRTGVHREWGVLVVGHEGARHAAPALAATRAEDHLRLRGSGIAADGARARGLGGERIEARHAQLVRRAALASERGF